MAFQDQVATLITNPANPCLTPAIAEKCRLAVGASGVYFLSDGIACDLPLPDTCLEPIEQLKEVLSSLEIDVVVQQAVERRKKALIADMDSTMIEQECIDELAEEANIGEHVAKITARTMNGELEFDQSLRERVMLLKGQPLAIVKKVLETRITYTPGGKELVGTMKANGAFCALVSGGFTQFTSHVGPELGFDENRANIFEIKDDKLTGKVVEPVLGREAKVEALNEFAKQQNLEPSDFLAVGDGANDLGMLKHAGSGVALHAKPIVAEQARFKINYGDLTALLYIQGYRKSDFITP